MPTRRILSALLITVFAITTQANAAKADYGTVTVIASTIPANGDLSPRGLASIPATAGTLVKGNLLVSNFSDSAGRQGKGSTIMQIAPDGTASLFAQVNANSLPGACTGGVGLTALVVLKTGWVIVGSLPTADGTSATAQAGCLIVLDSSGTPVETFQNASVNGPWGMTVIDLGAHAYLFVSNVLNGTVAAGGNVVNQGTILRIKLSQSASSMPVAHSFTPIATTLGEKTDPVNLAVGVAGMIYDGASILYLTDGVGDGINTIANPRTTLSVGSGKYFSGGGFPFSQPVGMVIGAFNTPISLNRGNSWAVLMEPGYGNPFQRIILDSSPGGGANALFGAVFTGQGIYFTDDLSNTLNLLP